MNKPRYVCPVCGFDGLGEPPYDEKDCPSYEICPRCGFEFGYDQKEDMARYRKDWIKRGSPWFRPELRPDRGDQKR